MPTLSFPGADKWDFMSILLYFKKMKFNNILSNLHKNVRHLGFHHQNSLRWYPDHTGPSHPTPPKKDTTSACYIGGAPMYVLLSIYWKER